MFHYSYDELGRLISADEGNNKWTYSYDSIGNIISSSSELGSDNYVYDKNHPDRLVEYNGQKIGKYKGGNPWQYLGYNLTWQNGHELSEIKVKTNTNKKTNGKSKDNDFSDSSTIDSVKNTYNHDGIRLSKTIGVGKNTKRYEYILNGNTILAQKTGEGENKEQLNFYYSADGKLLEIGYIQGNAKEKHYTVIMNAMGDVAALYTADGTYAGGYEYAPYGAVIAVNHNPDYADADGILEKNPFRYRGYYLDEETGWYYLNSRYYNPKVKRFINVDNPNYLGVGDEFNSYNLFAYCEGNPVNYDDQDGNCAQVLVGAALGAAFELGTQLINNGGDIGGIDWRKVAVSTTTGAVISGLGNAAMVAMDEKQLPYDNAGDMMNAFAVGFGSSFIGYGVGKTAAKIGGDLAINALGKQSSGYIKRVVLNSIDVAGRDRNMVKNLSFVLSHPQYSVLPEKLIGKSLPQFFNSTASGLVSASIQLDRG